ncbi:hypothetical protein PO878_18135 [Iamia majanohamensis]|uniref:Uncharacterized protein n=1 Tax=Iamia majanohamensis TaxID=467976 RepID=A0AAE9Y6E4_9ACTN|nr:hypothetical protein [Iamia majanohamensis]WCO66421.1 hypothetical protein PO878_18135 [Iamia majanohamensis]
MRLRRLLGRGDDGEGPDDGDVDGEDVPVAGASEDDEGEAPSADRRHDGDDGVAPATAGGEAEVPAGDDEDDEDAATTDDGADDDVAATTGDGADDDGGEGRRGFREVDFELSDWGARERKLLDEMLEGEGVRRVWQAGTLVVGARDADVVDDLIDEIDDRIALDLPPDVDPVVYDVRDWPEGLEDRFVEALIDDRVAHLRGYQEITVGVDDEERVDALVEQVTSAWEDEQPDEDELDGPDAQEVLSELFVTSDRLLHDASDKAATVRFDDAAQAAASMPVPFGFDESGWEAINAAAAVLRERLGDADAGDEEIEEAATALRTLLRPLV